MSLKSRLLKNREIKTFSSIQQSGGLDFLVFFKKNFDRLFAYSYNRIFAEANGIQTELGDFFPSENDFIQEIDKILRDFDGDKTNDDIIIRTKNDIRIKVIFDKENISYFCIEKIKKFDYGYYFAQKIISNEIAAYLKSCIKQKANIFVIDNSSAQNNLLNFMLNLTDTYNKNVIYDFSKNIFDEKPCNIYLSKNSLKDIPYIEYDNIFCSDINNKDLTEIFKLILSGIKGFNVSLSIKNNADIFAVLRNLILLENINLFEENADFLTNEAIDVLIFVQNDKNGKISVSKISEILKSKQNTFIQKDIFILNSDGTHISTGNQSAFYNEEKSSVFLKNYLEEGHRHSYFSNIKTFAEKEEKPDKKEKIKDKLKNLKNAFREEEIITVKQEETEPQEETPAEDVPSQNELPEQEIQKEETGEIPPVVQTEENDEYSNNGLLADENSDFSKEEIINETLYPQNQIRNIFEEYNDDNETVQVTNIEEPTEQEPEQSELTEDIQEAITEKYSHSTEKIVEEPVLFSEITDEEVAEYSDDNLNIDNEDI